MADPGKVGMIEQDVDAVFASYLIRLKIIDNAVAPFYLLYFVLSDTYRGYITGASERPQFSWARGLGYATCSNSAGLL
jgi:type I restriction enzyme S subunit